MMQKYWNGRIVDVTPAEQADIERERADHVGRVVPDKADVAIGRVDSDPLLSAMVDEIAEARGVGPDAVKASMRGRIRGGRGQR